MNGWKAEQDGEGNEGDRNMDRGATTTMRCYADMYVNVPRNRIRSGGMQIVSTRDRVWDGVFGRHPPEADGPTDTHRKMAINFGCITREHCSWERTNCENYYEKEDVAWRGGQGLLPPLLVLHCCRHRMRKVATDSNGPGSAMCKSLSRRHRHTHSLVPFYPFAFWVSRKWNVYLCLALRLLWSWLARLPSRRSLAERRTKTFINNPLLDSYCRYKKGRCGISFSPTLNVSPFRRVEVVFQGIFPSLHLVTFSLLVDSC